MTKLWDHENTHNVTCQTKTVNTEIIVNNPQQTVFLRHVSTAEIDQIMNRAECFIDLDKVAATPHTAVWLAGS